MFCSFLFDIGLIIHIFPVSGVILSSLHFWWSATVIFPICVLWNTSASARNFSALSACVLNELELACFGFLHDFPVSNVFAQGVCKSSAQSQECQWGLISLPFRLYFYLGLTSRLPVCLPYIAKISSAILFASSVSEIQLHVQASSCSFDV